MALPDIIIMGSPFVKYECTILMEIIHDLSKLKFNGEGEPSFRNHVRQFITFFKRHRIESRDVWAALLTLPFEGHVKKWCHTLPFASINSFG